jgi:hypothetical protein
MSACLVPPSSCHLLLFVCSIFIYNGTSKFVVSGEILCGAVVYPVSQTIEEGNVERLGRCVRLL